jgi:hypothetical protein
MGQHKEITIAETWVNADDIEGPLTPIPRNYKLTQGREAA